MKIDKKQLSTWAAGERDSFESTLKSLVEIPSVSADPSRAGDIRRCAEAVASLIREHGGEARLLETDGHPLVHGRFDAGPDFPPVTISNPPDVQPGSRETEPW